MTRNVVIQASRVSWMVKSELIVSDVSVSIHQAERIAILGPNGAGKSSLLKILGLMNQPCSGELQLFGEDIRRTTVRSRRQLRSRVAWIPQGLQVVGQVTALTNAMLGALSRVNPLTSLFGWFPTHEAANAHHALTAVGVDHMADRRTDSLSGGERQKVAIARALVQGGDIVLADEPTAALDPAASEDMMLLLRKLSSERGLTTVVVLHDIDLAMGFADRILGMKNGRLVLDAPVKDLNRADLDALYTHQVQPKSNKSGFVRRVQ